MDDDAGVDVDFFDWSGHCVDNFVGVDVGADDDIGWGGKFFLMMMLLLILMLMLLSMLLVMILLMLLMCILILLRIFLCSASTFVAFPTTFVSNLDIREMRNVTAPGSTTG